MTLSPPVLAALLLLAASIGALIAWLWAGRTAGTLRAEGAAMKERLAAAFVDLDAAKQAGDAANVRREEVERLLVEVRAEAAARDQAHAAWQAATAARESEAARELATARAAVDAARADHRAETALRLEAERVTAELKASQAERDRAHAAQIETLKAAEERLVERFHAIGAKVLEGAQDQFLKRADDRFRQTEEAQAKSVEGLLAPVAERLGRYEAAVQKIERERTEAYGNLTGLIEAMRDGQERVQREAHALVNSLRNAPKARGRWGEQQLCNVLEASGLTRGIDFEMEVSRDTEDGRLRPDAVIRTPGGGQLVVDAKVTFNDFGDATSAPDDAARAACLARHAANMKAHVASLGSKDYFRQFDQAPEFVIMFVPGEHFLSAALEQDPDLWNFAFDKKVLLATPTNLVAIARTFAGIWRQEAMAAQARHIGELGRELYKRMAVMADHVARLGKNLGQSVDAYNRFVGSLDAQVLTQARRFEELSIDTAGRSIDTPGALEVTPRPSTKLLPTGPEADPPSLAAE